MINNKLFEIQKLNAMVYSVTISNDKERIQTSADKDRLGATVAKIIDLGKETDELIDRFYEKKKHIVNQIDGMENSDYYHILSLRYVGGETFESIANTTKWSIRQVFKLHGRALQEFEKLYGEEYLKK